MNGQLSSSSAQCLTREDAVIFSDQDSPVDVFFDDFRIEHIKSYVVASQDYYPFGLTYNSYQKENALEQGHKFNGKESQDELNLGWSDFGMRMYQPSVGRFFNADKLMEITPFKTPYAFGGNNPVKNGDLGGGIEFPAEFRAQYPKVTAYLEMALPYMASNQTILNTISTSTTRSKDDIVRELQNTPGTPHVRAKDMGELRWGEYTGPNSVDKLLLKINEHYLLDQFENALASNDPAMNDTRNRYAVITVVAILHEYVHYCYYVQGVSRRVNKEEGSDWEMDAFGVYFDYLTKEEARQFNTDWNDKTSMKYNPKIHQNTMEYFLEIHPSGGGIPLPPESTNPGPAPKKKKHKFAKGRGEY